jgi:hypothetical protein
LQVHGAIKAIDYENLLKMHEITYFAPVTIVIFPVRSEILAMMFHFCIKEIQLGNRKLSSRMHLKFEYNLLDLDIDAGHFD